jgi:hypothetical protein
MEERNAYRILVEKPEGNNYLENLRHRFYSNTKRDLKEMAFDAVNWIFLALDGDKWRAPVNTAISFRVPLNVSSCWIASGNL